MCFYCFKEYSLFIFNPNQYCFSMNIHAIKATEWREGKMEIEKKVRVRQDGYVSGILSANGLIYHCPRCYGNRHSGQIMGCWSGVFLFIFLFCFPASLKGLEFIPSALEREGEEEVWEKCCFHK